MLDPLERTQPVMEYVLRLQRTVREYRQTELRYQFWWFCGGIAAGGIAVWIADRFLLR